MPPPRPHRTNGPTRWELTLATLVVLLATIILVGVSGCAGKSSSRFDGQRVVRVDDQGVIEVRQTASGYGRSQSPPGASESSPMDVTFAGVRSQLAGVWDTTRADAAAKTALPYALGAIGMLALAAWMASRGQFKTAAAFGAAAAVCGGLPVVLDKAGGWIAAIVVLSLLGALAAVAWLVWRYRQRGVTAARKLFSENRPLEAIAARRAADPAYDADPSQWKPIASGASSAAGSVS